MYGFRACTHSIPSQKSLPQIDVSNEERLKDELSGGSFAGKADAELFFVDKAPSADRAPAPKVCCG